MVRRQRAWSPLDPLRRAGHRNDFLPRKEWNFRFHGRDALIFLAEKIAPGLAGFVASFLKKGYCDVFFSLNPTNQWFFDPQKKYCA